MKSLLTLTLLLASAAGLVAETVPEVVRTYKVRQTVTVSDIPAGAKSVKFWISIPDNERYQEVLDFAVPTAPGSWSVLRDADRGNRFLLVESKEPKEEKLSTQIEFTVRRRSCFAAIDPTKVGALTDSHRTLYAEELRKDAPHMSVTPAIQAMADKACGTESNVALQARHLLDAVADYADHYSKDASKPKCGIGDAGDCMTNAGGCCTDMHSLFIALARARGIPTRLEMGYRLRENNEGKEVDPGYRCWVEYFVPSYGWVSADVVEADSNEGLARSRWLSGLTERRVWLNEGREFDLPGRKDRTQRVNTMIIGYAEIDGVAARVLPDPETLKPAQLSRTVHYTEVKSDVMETKVADLSR
jgi:transglutaminase-like putative cysteine protease